MADKNEDGSVDEITKCPDCGSTHLKRDYVNEIKTYALES